MGSFAHAEFAMNFMVNTEDELPGRDSAIRDIYWNSDNEWGKQGVQTGSPGTPQQTPYLQDNNSLERAQIVTDPDNGNTYYHMIFGDFSTGFIQESYIQMGFGNYGNTALGEPTNSASASGGASAGAGDYNSVTTFGNGYDPLDMDTNETAKLMASGNGTANPRRVIVRQIVSDGQIFMEFHKNRYDYKPRISQAVYTPDITSLFDIDMSGILVDDMETEAPIINTMELWGEGLMPDAMAFDMNKDKQNSTVSGGKYRYIDGAGYGGADGTYEYISGSYDQESVEWSLLYDEFSYNPWAFEEAKPEHLRIK